MKLWRPKYNRGFGNVPQLGVPLRLNRSHYLYNSIVHCMVPSWDVGSPYGIDLVTRSRTWNTSWPTPANSYVAGQRRAVAGYRYKSNDGDTPASKRPTTKWTAISLFESTGGISGTSTNAILWFCGHPDYIGGIVLYRYYTADMKINARVAKDSATWSGGASTNNVIATNVMQTYGATGDGTNLRIYAGGAYQDSFAAAHNAYYNTTKINWLGGNQFDSNYVGGHVYMNVVLDRCLSDLEMAMLNTRLFELVEPDLTAAAISYHFMDAGSPPPATNLNNRLPLLGVGD